MPSNPPNKKVSIVKSSISKQFCQALIAVLRKELVRGVENKNKNIVDHPFGW